MIDYDLWLEQGPEGPYDNDEVDPDEEAQKKAEETDFLSTLKD